MFKIYIKGFFLKKKNMHQIFMNNLLFVLLFSYHIHTNFKKYQNKNKNLK